jgi:hypothetical protein
MMMPSLMGTGTVSPQQLAMMQQQWNNQMRMMAMTGTTPANTPANPSAAPTAATTTTPGEVLAAFASHHIWAGDTPGTTTAVDSTETKKKRGGRRKGSKNKPKDIPTDTTATTDGVATEATATTDAPKTTTDGVATEATATTDAPETTTDGVTTEATTTTVALETTTDGVTTEATTTTVAPETTDVSTPATEDATADAGSTPQKTPSKPKKPRPTPEGPAPSSGIPWLDEFRTFLETVPHGRMCRVASRSNATRIIGVVKKLAMGEGVGTKAWPVSFYKDVAVDMSMDMKLLRQHADDFQKQYGDPSNGWLLNHPTDKLLLYQEYKNDPEAFQRKVQEAIDEKAKKVSATPSSVKKKTKKASTKTSPAASSGDSAAGGSEHGPSVNDPVIETILRQAASEAAEVAPQHPNAAASAQPGMAEAASPASPVDLRQHHVSPNESAHAALARQAIQAAMAASQAAPRSPSQGSVEWTDQFLTTPHRAHNAQAEGHEHNDHDGHQQYPGGRGFSYY